MVRIARDLDGAVLDNFWYVETVDELLAGLPRPMVEVFCRCDPGVAYERLQLAITRDVAVYAAHLPLDTHATFGNNALLAGELGLVPNGRFASYQAAWIGVRGDDDVATRTIVERAAAFAARFEVPVAKDGETKLTYRVRIKY